MKATVLHHKTGVDIDQAIKLPLLKIIKTIVLTISNHGHRKGESYNSEEL